MIIEGTLEGKQVTMQHLFIPFTEMEMANLGEFERYQIENVDINFNGAKDLLIHEGYSSGSGGNCTPPTYESAHSDPAMKTPVLLFLSVTFD